LDVLVVAYGICGRNHRQGCHRRSRGISAQGCASLYTGQPSRRSI